MGRATAKVAHCKEVLAQARTARKAFDQPTPDPLDPPREYRTYTGEEWLAAKRGAFGPPRDTDAIADDYRERADVR